MIIENQFDAKDKVMSKNEKVVFELNPREQDDASTKIETIKNLIFGETIQAYDIEFEQLKQDILDKKKALEDLVDEVHTELKQTLDNLSTDVNIRIGDLEKRLEDKLEDLDAATVDKKILGTLLIDMGKKISDK